MRIPQLDPNVRTALAQRVLVSLERAVPGSTAELRGSLAEGRADLLSDIDVYWEIPDDLFPESVARLPEILPEVGAVESLRLDPDWQHSDKRRIVFVQFQGMPLFWRVDLNISARSIHGHEGYAPQKPAARGDDSSRTYSALMNAVAAVKVLLRNQEEDAEQLLVRAFERIGLAAPEGNPRDLILKLTESVASMDPALAGLARRIEELHREAFD